jgi:mono/diheme cytochrome c family protein
VLKKRIPVAVSSLPLLCLIIIFLFMTGGCSQQDSSVEKAVTNEGISQSEEDISLNPDEKIVGDPVVGKRIYEKYCFYCHGREGRGDGAIAIAVEPKPIDFVADKKRMAKPDRVLIKSISEGVIKDDDAPIVMPAWKAVLSVQERWDVLSYVRVLSERGRNTRK